MKKAVRASLIFVTLLFAVAAFAKTKRYDVEFTKAVDAAGTQLKAGTYQVEVDGNSIVFYQRQKEVAKVPVHSEEAQMKPDSTAVTLTKDKLIAIQLGGTKTKLIVDGAE